MHGMVYRGLGALAKLPQMMEALGLHRPMFVGSTRFLASLPEGTVHFNHYHPNPDFDDALLGADVFRQMGCDGFVSIGGGSAMDTAKAIKAVLLSDSVDDALHNRLTGSAALPHIAVPATAGSGAEATPTAVVYQHKEKCSLQHDRLLPEGVILDGSLLATLPDYHKKSCAMDALCQGIESYWAKMATEDSRVHAFLAITGVLDNLREYLNGAPLAAQAMLEAAYRSGRAICTSKTTAAHAMSYQLTQTMGIAHGHACMLTLPALFEQLLSNEEVLPILMDIAQKMRLGSENMVPKLLWGMMMELDLPIPPMPDEEHLNHLVRTVNPERLDNHPAPLTETDIRRAYVRALTPLTGREKQVAEDLWRYYGQDQAED